MTRTREQMRMRTLTRRMNARTRKLTRRMKWGTRKRTRRARKWTRRMTRTREQMRMMRMMTILGDAGGVWGAAAVDAVSDVIARHPPHDRAEEVRMRTLTRRMNARTR